MTLDHWTEERSEDGAVTQDKSGRARMTRAALSAQLFARVGEVRFASRAFGRFPRRCSRSLVHGFDAALASLAKASRFKTLTEIRP